MMATLIRKLMQHYWRWSRGLTLGVQCCLIDDAERVILVRHGYRPGWHFPGGGVEKGEPVLKALERELIEEVGVTLNAPPRFVGVFDNGEGFPGDHILLFHAIDWSQPRVPEPNFEIKEINRFAVRALPDTTHPPTRARVKEILDQEPPPMHWHVSKS